MKTTILWRKHQYKMAYRHAKLFPANWHRYDLACIDTFIPFSIRVAAWESYHNSKKYDPLIDKSRFLRFEYSLRLRGHNEQ